jgi:hypothetical protein
MLPHFHEHLIFTGSKIQEALGLLKVFVNIIGLTTRLSDKEFEARKTVLTEQLRQVL